MGKCRREVTSKSGKLFPGSAPRTSAAAYVDELEAKLKAELMGQWIWQDLVADFGCGGSYESVKRLLRKLVPERRQVGVLRRALWEEAQVDFFQGPLTLDEKGCWRWPLVFQVTLSHSQHGYEEAVWGQEQESFLWLHGRAFAALGGVPKVVRQDYVPCHNRFYVAAHALCPCLQRSRGGLGLRPKSAVFQHATASDSQREWRPSMLEKYFVKPDHRSNPRRLARGRNRDLCRLARRAQL